MLNMRKSLWIMLAVIVVAVSAPHARADSFTYTYSDNGISWTTTAISAVTMQTTVPAADLTATSNTGFVAGCTTSGVVLDDSGTGNITTDFSGCNVLVISFGSFPLTDFSTPGTYELGGTTLVVTPAVATPEPSSVALMLLGGGLVLLRRKRNSRGHQLAT